MTIDLKAIEARDEAALKTALHKPRLPFKTWILLKQDIPALIAEVRRLKKELEPAAEQESWPELERYRELAKVVREMLEGGYIADADIIDRAAELLKEVEDAPQT